jgi:hypothetical protein
MTALATGRYITSDDLYNQFGTTNINVWSNLDGTAVSPNVDRLVTAIAYGEAAVENRFRRSRYAVPFVRGNAPGGGWDPMLIDWMSVLAGVWLYRGRRMRQGDTPNDNVLSGLLAKTGAEMNDVLAGKYTLPLGMRRGDSPDSPFALD